MTMRRSPRRPLILRRRKLPFQQNDQPTAEPQSQPAASCAKEPSEQDAGQSFTDGIRVMDHPTLSDTQVVLLPKTADLQRVIGALTVKGKECGAQGRNKFILLSENGDGESGSVGQASVIDASAEAAGQPGKAEPTHASTDVKPLTAVKLLNKDLECGPLDNSLTNIQWLGTMSTAETDPAKQMENKENQSAQVPNPQMDAEPGQQSQSERPPYSYMAMIQFAINSRKSRRMTLKEIYMWIEDHFPYFREVAKPGWKNSIRHNLSLHDMFIRDTSPDGKLSYWTIRPEANRCLTLDQVYRPGFDPMTAPVPVPMLLLSNQQQRRILPDVKKPSGSERRIKPLLPRTESYLIPVQLPVTSSVYVPSPQTQFPPFSSQQKQIASRGVKRVRIAPKVTQSDAPAVVVYPQNNNNNNNNPKVKEEPVCVPIKCETPKSLTPKSLPKRQVSSSRRKQRLVHSLSEEPVLLCPENTFLDSGVVSDASTFHDFPDSELKNSPDREFSFKTPIKSSNHLTSSTPSKPPCSVAPEPWKVTPLGKGSQSVLDFSPIRTPGGPAVTPRHEYTTFSFNSTPFKDWQLFNSPRELLNGAPSKATALTGSPIECIRSSCSRELLQAGGSTPANRSITEGLVLDTMNDSLSKILVDISFSCMDDEDLGTANISWSEFFPQLK